jgi:xanthine dehydrogenase molybdenum-binding subunit
VASTTGRVGERLAKVDVRNVVLGKRPYVADMRVDGMLHGALRFSDHPRARVVRIDVSRAEALDGVLCVLRAGDVPAERHIGLIYPDWPVLVSEGEVTRYTGDVLACVAATSRDIARQAAALIDVDYEVLEPVTDPHTALRPDAPKVHDNGNQLSTCVVHKGDVDSAFAHCTYVSEGVYETQRIEHGYMEPEACLAVPEDDGGVRAYVQSQGVYEDRRQLCALLGLPAEKVRVELVPNGGGFGGKEDMSVQSHATMMALKLHRPVHVELSREESLRMSVKRHPIWMHFKLGCDDKGRLQALRARIVGDTGAYASVGTKVLERAAGHATGAYTVPNVDIESITVYTNNVPCGAMRGFGANQACFAMESCVDDLIHQAGFDPWQFRWDNALVEGGTTATGQELSSGVGVRATLEAVRDAYDKATHAGHKVGLACGLKNTGIGNGMLDDGRAKIIVRDVDHIELHHGWTEMGQGVDTMALQTFCQETGLPPTGVTVHCRTDAETSCGMTTASRATSLVGNALIAACRPFRKDLAELGLQALVGREYFGEWICDWTNKPGSEGGAKPVTHYSYSYATQLVVLDDAGKVQKIVAAHDAGRIMNPTLFEGQIEGSIHMGLGYALTEDFAVKPDGHPKSLMLRSCGILRAHQTPEIEVIGVEVPDEHGPYGAKGVGEIGLVPTAAAVGNALFAFDGERRRILPMKA